jgi:hypothetical protein
MTVSSASMTAETLSAFRRMAYLSWDKPALSSSTRSSSSSIPHAWRPASTARSGAQQHAVGARQPDVGAQLVVLGAGDGVEGLIGGVAVQECGEVVRPGDRRLDGPAGSAHQLPNRDRVRPGGGLRPSFERAQVGDQTDQHFLGGVLRVVRVAAEPQCQPVHQFLDLPAQPLQRRPVPVAGRQRQAGQRVRSSLDALDLPPARSRFRGKTPETRRLHTRTTPVHPDDLDWPCSGDDLRLQRRILRSRTDDDRILHLGGTQRIGGSPYRPGMI